MSDSIERGRDRIARYCGGFEIHCPLDAGFKSLSRRHYYSLGIDVAPRTVI